ncbi:MAG: membrane protein insertase YidC [Gammaproteobacteria bacterium]|nr:membrane protein insertase YidC [Gammaproteobacteria bacterium]
MDNYRFFLLALLVTLSYALWQNWQIDYNEAYRRSLSPEGEDFRAKSDQQNSETSTDTFIYGEVPESQASADLPAANTTEKPAAVPNTIKAATADSQRILVTTDVYRLEIDTTGGDVRLVELLQYPKTKKDPDSPIKILNDGKDGAFFVAQSGLIGSPGIKTPTHRDQFRASASSYSLSDNDVLDVPLVWTQPSGLQVTKTYRFKRGSYEIEVEQTVQNNSNTVWSGQQYLQLQRTGLREEDKSFFVRSFTGAVTYTEEDKYRKHEFADLEDENISEITKEGWIAMIQHYFLSAWIPPVEDVVRIYSKALQNGRYIIGAISPSSQVNVQPGKAVTLTSQLVVGPKIQKDLEAIATGLELTVDFGVLTFIAKPIFWLLTKFHEFAKNWGIAIILVTFSIKALFFKLSEKSYKSMARMRKLQPKLESLREKFGDDKQRMNMEIMQLYKREKVNPLGGCLPVMVQIPVFISLYWVLLESVELRQAPFFLWIQDLSTKDPYFILPALMGLSMFIQQKLNPTPIDPMQQQIMRLFPVVFTIFFAFFPAGLVLYWVVNNTLSIMQQWYITRQIEKAG